jgi:putative transposase
MPLITPTLERFMFEYIFEKAKTIQTNIYAINGTQDHIHIAASIAPKWSIADWVKQIKGASSYEVNRTFPNLETKFQWQDSYGVLSFGTKDMEFVLAYVHNQKDHHAENTLYTYLEREE